MLFLQTAAVYYNYINYIFIQGPVQEYSGSVVQGELVQIKFIRRKLSAYR